MIWLAIGGASLLLVAMMIWGWIVIGDRLSPGVYEGPVKSLVDRVKDWLRD